MVEALNPSDNTSTVDFTVSLDVTPASDIVYSMRHAVPGNRNEKGKLGQSRNARLVLNDSCQDFDPRIKLP